MSDLFKNTRRKRQDPESRDFTCRCGKKYLSYAAAYTHVKNKHNLEKEYLENIGKPQKQKGQRGRPKDKKEIEKDVEGQLQLVENTVWQIFEALEQRLGKVILEGNSVRNVYEQEKCLNELAQSHLHQQTLDYRAILQGQEAFLEMFCKHFTAPVVARILLVLCIQTEHQVKVEEGREQENSLERYLRVMDLWNGTEKVNELILELHHSWQNPPQ